MTCPDDLNMNHPLRGLVLVLAVCTIVFVVNTTPRTTSPPPPQKTIVVPSPTRDDILVTAPTTSKTLPVVNNAVFTSFSWPTPITDDVLYGRTSITTKHLMKLIVGLWFHIHRAVDLGYTLVVLHNGAFSDAFITRYTSLQVRFRSYHNETYTTRSGFNNRLLWYLSELESHDGDFASFVDLDTVVFTDPSAHFKETWASNNRKLFMHTIQPTSFYTSGTRRDSGLQLHFTQCAPGAGYVDTGMLRTYNGAVSGRWHDVRQVMRVVGVYLRRVIHMPIVPPTPCDMSAVSAAMHDLRGVYGLDVIESHYPPTRPMDRTKEELLMPFNHGCCGHHIYAVSERCYAQFLHTRNTSTALVYSAPLETFICPPVVQDIIHAWPPWAHYE